jgi:hypothetical protein
MKPEKTFPRISQEEKRQTGKYQRQDLKNRSKGQQNSWPLGSRI